MKKHYNKSMLFKKIASFFICVTLLASLFTPVPIAYGDGTITFLNAKDTDTIYLGDALEWQLVVNANYYLVSIRNLDTGKLVEDKKKLQNTNRYVFNENLGAGKYRFWMAAYKSDGTQLAFTSEKSSFDNNQGLGLNVKNRPQSKTIKMISPKQNGTITNPKIRFEWESVSNALIYKFYYDYYKNPDDYEVLDEDETYKEITLGSGTYTVRVEALENVYSIVKACTFSITVDAKYFVSVSVVDEKTSELLKGAIVKLGSNSQTTGTIGNSNGKTYSCSFSDIDNGKYSISCTRSGYKTYNGTLTVNGSNKDYTIEMERAEGAFSVSGIVEDDIDDFPIEGANVSIGDYSTITDKNGRYEIKGLDIGDYSIKVTCTGYKDKKSNVNINYDNVSDKYISLTKIPTVFSGKVTTQSGVGLEGVTIKFSINSGTGNVPGSVVTDSDGYWEQKGFSKDCKYSVMPQKEGYTFFPTALGDIWGNSSQTLSFQASPKDTVPPTVAKTSATENVSIQDVFNVIFSEKVIKGANFDKISITKNGVTVKYATIGLYDNQLTFNHDGVYWEYDATYKVTIPAGAITDVEGNKLNNEYIVNFKTIKDTTVKDTTPPSVTGTMPTKDVDINGSIEITFSEKIIEGTNFNSIKVENAGVAVKDVNIKLSENKVIISSKGTPWAYDTTYCISIPAGAVKDVSGNLYAQYYITNFTTIKDTTVKDTTPPTVTGSLLSKDVDIQGNIEVTFSENILEGTNFNSIKVENAGAAVKDINVKLSENKVIISNKGIPWAYETTYKITIPAGAVKDSAGNSLKNDYLVSFTTVKDATIKDTVAPIVVRTTSISNVGVQGSLEIIFDENINEGTNFSSINVINADTILKNIDVKISGSKIVISNKGTSWAYNTTYTVSVPKGAVKDESGNLFVNDYTVSFTTEKQVPVVTSSPIQSNVVVSQPIITIPATSSTFSIKGVTYRKYSGRNSRVPNPIVKITYDKEGQKVVNAEVDSQGNFKADIPADGKDYNLVVSREDYESISTPINPSSDNSNMIIEIALTKGLFELEGTVINKYSSEGIGNAEVYLNIEDPNAGMNWKEVTDENGHFKFKGVAGGTTHSLRIRKSGYVDENCNEPKLGVEVKNSNVNLGYISIINTIGFVNISGKVTDKDTRRALPGVKVNIQGSTSFISTTDANGIYRIPGVASNAEHILEFSNIGYYAKSLKVKVLNKNLCIDQIICRLRKLSGHVYEGYFVGKGSNIPIKGATVWVNDQSWKTNTLKDGSYKFEGAAPATHALFAKCNGYKSINLNNYQKVDINLANNDGVFNLFLIKNENIPDDWAKDIIKKAYEYGILTESTKVNFGSSITRLEFAELSVKLYEKLYGKQISTSKTIDFIDIKSDIVRKARSISLINGDENNKFYPNQKISRQEMAVILYRLFKQIYIFLNIPFIGAVDGINVKYFKFSDGNKIKDWAQDAVGFMVSNEIMSGTGNNCFSPDDEAQKQQGVAVILRGLNKVRSINNSISKLVEDAKVYNSTVNVKQYFESWNAKLVLANSKKIIAVKSNKVILYTQGDKYIYVNDSKDNTVSRYMLDDFTPIKLLNNDVRVSLEFANSLENELSFIDIVNNYEDSNLYKSIKQIIMGEYTDAVTLEGTGGQLFLAFLGLDAPGDVRDLCANVQNWEWSWGHVGNTALNVVSVVPIIGCIKYGDEAYVVFKHSDEVREITKVSDLENAPEVTKFIENATNSELKYIDGKWISNSTDVLRSNSIKFGSNAKSAEKLANQMQKRGWDESLVRQTVDSPYTTRVSKNLATGNSSTVYYMKDGSYVIVDDITNEVVQISDRFDTNWIPDVNIINPYKP